ncbi:hypothetical protein VTN96DRAFT_2355 [Rasamsonia emersonii]
MGLRDPFAVNSDKRPVCSSSKNPVLIRLPGGTRSTVVSCLENRTKYCWMSKKTAKVVGAYPPKELTDFVSDSVERVELVSTSAVVVQCRPHLATSFLPPRMFFLHDCPQLPDVLLGPIERDVYFSSYDACQSHMSRRRDTE